MNLPPVTGPARALADAGLAVHVFGGIWGNPTASQAEAGAAAYKAHAADGIVAIGGGAALDVAKCIAVLAKHPGKLLEYDAFLAKPRPIDLDVPPIFTVPTTAGTGSEVGRSAVVSDDESHQKKIIFSPKLLAKRVFLDPELSLSLPAKVTAATGMDALTHCVESYLHPMFHPMCDGIALEGLRLIAHSLPRAVAFAERVEAGDAARTGRSRARRSARRDAVRRHDGRRGLPKGLGSRPLVRALPVDGGGPAPRPRQRIMIVVGMRFNQPVSAVKMATMAATVGAPDATADGFIAWLETFRSGIGIPRSLRAVGVTDAQVAALVENALADVCHTFGRASP